MQEYKDIKLLLLRERVQLLTLNQSGEISGSCNSLFKVSPGTPITQVFSFSPSQHQSFLDFLENDHQWYSNLELVVEKQNARPPVLAIFELVKMEKEWIHACYLIELPPPTPVTKKEVTPSSNVIRALLVEKNPLNQKVIQKYLSEAGIELYNATSSEEARLLVKDTTVHLIILENHLKLNEQEEIFRIAQELGNVPVIGLTSLSDRFKLDQDHNFKFEAVFSTSPLPSDLGWMIKQLMKKGPTESSNGAHKINLQYLREVTGNNPSIMIELIDIFLEAFPEAISEMHNYYKTKDFSLLKNTAHRIKANFKYFGLENLFTLSNQIERCCAKRRNLKQIPDQILLLEDASKALIPELKSMKKKLMME